MRIPFIYETGDKFDYEEKFSLFGFLLGGLTYAASIANNTPDFLGSFLMGGIYAGIGLLIGKRVDRRIARKAVHLLKGDL